MRFRPVPALLISIVLLSPCPAHAGPVDPHSSPEGCPVCHIAIPTPEDAARECYFLVRETIDGTCKTCHSESGCALGVNRTAHQSDISLWDARSDTGLHPRTLPLHDGKIVCTTCHYRTKQVDDSYRRIRKATWNDGQPDLRPFCADCHGTG